MTDRYLAYFRLVEAFREPGCPVCRCVGVASRRYLGALVYEQVNDPEIRRRLRASWGFCNWHTWMLADLPDSTFGTAIIHEDLLRAVGHRASRLGAAAARPTRGSRAWLSRLAGTIRLPAIVRLHRRRQPCPACLDAAEAEARYIEIQATFVSELQFQRAYEASDGLCVPHAMQAIERAGGRPEAAELVRLTVHKWDALRRTVEQFVSKHDYRNTEPFSEDEAASCRRALGTIAGEPNLFGNDRWRIREAPPPVVERDGAPGTFDRHSSGARDDSSDGSSSCGSTS